MPATIDLPDHTYRRNYNSVALSCACMGGQPDPLFEMGLQRGDAPLILRGIVRENRAWCRVLEFAEEFGISASFEPFMLWGRRGG